MSWRDILLELISDITDPQERLDIIRTINYILMQYENGEIDYDAAKGDIAMVVRDVLMDKDPTLDEEEATQRAIEYAERLLRKYRVRSMFRRARKRYNMLERYK